MNQQNREKLKQAIIKADMLFELKTGHKGAVINYINEMYKHGCSVDDMINILDEGLLSWVWDSADDGSKEYAAAKEVGKYIGDERKRSLINGTAKNITDLERHYIDKKLALEKRQSDIKRDIAYISYGKAQPGRQTDDRFLEYDKYKQKSNNIERENDKRLSKNIRSV